MGTPPLLYVSYEFQIENSERNHLLRAVLRAAARWRSRFPPTGILAEKPGGCDGEMLQASVHMLVGELECRSIQHNPMRNPALRCLRSLFGHNNLKFKNFLCNT